MAFQLPKLKYQYNALEKSIDPMTMEIHYSKHHQAYVDNLNKALEQYPELFGLSLDQLLQRIGDFAADIRMKVRNNGGGHWNHSFFWDILTPDLSNPSERLQDKIKEFFGTFDNFKTEFKKVALDRFGSGWAWLIKDSENKLKLVSTPNQDNPLMDIVEERGTPVLGLDVWEHAYYLRYQNRRADYIDAFWDVVDWKRVEELIFEN